VLEVNSMPAWHGVQGVTNTDIAQALADDTMAQGEAVTPAQVARAPFAGACDAELAALKPGNVHVHANGHGMTVAQFRRSARAAAPWLSTAGLKLGRARAGRGGGDAERGRAQHQSRASCCWRRRAVPCRADASGPGPAGRGSRGVLARLTRTDARAVFQAIALAAPAGLGTRKTGDVRKPPRIGLVDAMRLAARRDLVARQYVSDFAIVLGIGRRLLERDLAAGLDIEAATTWLHMTFLRRFPDSHIGRKHGARCAASVRDEARRVPDAPRALKSFDRSLKKRGLNPGTTADLVVASLLAYRLTSIVRPAA
jgi:triphosphoribosyl-dephospho-CoA synthase